MIRFPNPGSAILSFIHIFQTIYTYLKDKPYFTLDDMSRTLTQMNLAASSGYVGEQALQLSTRDDRSRDPLYNQSKMYAELYRSLGWMSSQEDKALLFSFTLLGAHVAAAKLDPRSIFEESILGINYPNDVIGNKNTEKMRPFAGILITAAELDNMICRDEMIIGPMNIDDTNDRAFGAMITKLKNIRGNFNALQKEIENLSSKISIQINTMQNYTRFPISVLEYCQWAVKERNKKAYPQSRGMVMLILTDQGKDRVAWLRNVIDLRNDFINQLDEREKESTIKVAFYKMLERSGFNILPVMGELREHFNICDQIFGKDAELLYSPYQTTKTLIVNQALNYIPANEENIENAKLIDSEGVILEGQTVADKNHQAGSIVRISVDGKVDTSKFIENKIAFEIKRLLGNGVSETKIVEILFEEFRSAKKEVFYPLVADLFRVLGFDCHAPRPGINYERWDAIAVDESRTIPIEIKSPTEEEFISIKGVRQALENKIILLSRKIYKTDMETVSLVVGYRTPNNRAEVISLIEAIKDAFGIRIGVIDFYSLIELAVNAIGKNKPVEMDDIRRMEGLINVDDLRTEIE